MARASLSGPRLALASYRERIRHAVRFLAIKSFRLGGVPVLLRLTNTHTHFPRNASRALPNRNRLERRTEPQGRLSPIPAPKHLNSSAHRLRGRDEFPELWISLQLLILTGRQAGSVEEILQRVAT